MWAHFWWLTRETLKKECTHSNMSKCPWPLKLPCKCSTGLSLVHVYNSVLIWHLDGLHRSRPVHHQHHQHPTHDRCTITGCLLSGVTYTRQKTAQSCFREHENTTVHRACTMSWMNYKVTLQDNRGDAVEQLQAGSVSEIQEWREYPLRIVTVTAFLGKQWMPFRGNEENGSNQNLGFSLECMNLLSKFDPFLQL